jgi:hypothetical protein
MEKIQEIIFENKESIPNGVYLELMNQLKKSYITKDDNQLIKITYTRIRPMFHKNDDGGYNITLIKTNNLFIIAKKTSFKNKSDYSNNNIEQLDAMPFVPFFISPVSSSVFNDEGYKNDIKTLFLNIKKNPDNDENDDEWDFEEDEEEKNKRKIAYSLELYNDIEYLITNVEKLN